MTNSNDSFNTNLHPVGEAHTPSSNVLEVFSDIKTLTRRDATNFVAKLKGFISYSQLDIIEEIGRSEEKQFIFQKLEELANQVETMPKIYETDGMKDKKATLHYFIGGCNWWIIEKDSEAEQHQAYGLADLGFGAELGYISIVELIKNGAELDLYFTPKKVSEL